MSKKYIIFTSKGVELLGSDQLFRFDNRLSRYSIVRAALARKKQLRFVQPDIDGANVYFGDIRTGRILYSINLQD